MKALLVLALFFAAFGCHRTPAVVQSDQVRPQLISDIGRMREHLLAALTAAQSVEEEAALLKAINSFAVIEHAIAHGETVAFEPGYAAFFYDSGGQSISLRDGDFSKRCVAVEIQFSGGPRVRHELLDRANLAFLLRE